MIAANDKRYARFAPIGTVVQRLARADLTPAGLVPDFARHARAALELPPDDADGSCKPL